LVEKGLLVTSTAPLSVAEPRWSITATGTEYAELNFLI
jgi:hypothetical protein